ncbi:MerR family transcriptional regulator [Planococcus halocryophilus]|uniref:MerR family transcriptional regulator n=1 Tax=Planococcus halocryophilus TaxID=1215089 RepID=UPI001F0D2141|nr:MerR family transcriptional regulator [Planococcus halocryophilus]MCH4828149.1 MerR family transcriptional regulator [Planococcus halocryophilus]
MEEWYTVGELAEKTGIAEPTLRRYITKFHPYFVSKGGNRAKKYKGTAIPILVRIKALYDAGYETAGLADVIRREFPVIINDNKHSETEESQSAAVLATTEDVTELKKVLTEVNQKLAKQEEFNALLIQKLEDQNRFIKKALENPSPLFLEKKTDEEEAAKPAKESKKGFWNRFFK